MVFCVQYVYESLGVPTSAPHPHTYTFSTHTGLAPYIRLISKAEIFLVCVHFLERNMDRPPSLFLLRGLLSDGESPGKVQVGLKLKFEGVAY